MISSQLSTLNKCNHFLIIQINSQRLTGNEQQVGGYDLIYKGRHIEMDEGSIFHTYLGCLNNRKEQMLKLAKVTKDRLLKEKTEQNQMK